MKRYKPVAEPRKPGRKHLTLDEWRALYGVARARGAREGVIMRLMYEVGLRASEPGLLRLDHCKRLHLGSLYVPRGKDGSSGWLEITRGLVDELTAWIDNTYPHRGKRKATSFVFPARRRRGKAEGISRWLVYDLVHDCAIDAGIAEEVAHPHAIRHGRVQHLIEAAETEGLPLESMIQAVAKIVGHKAAQTTIAHYVATTGRGKQVIDSVLARALGEDDE